MYVCKYFIVGFLPQTALENKIELLDSIRKHCTGAMFSQSELESIAHVLYSHWAFDINARGCSMSAGRSKSLLGLVLWSV